MRTTTLLVVSVLALPACRMDRLGRQVDGTRATGDGQPAAIAAAEPVRPQEGLILLSPQLLTTLRERATAKSAPWVALRADCEQRVGKKVEWPDGNRYPSDGAVGEGYQGDGYFHPLLNLSLCYQVATGVEPARAKAYARQGAEILERMSEPAGPRSVNPLRDSGFGIRYYGVGMALGYDWLRPQLAAPLQQRVRAALERWIAGYEKSGFGRDHPQGNYFAGYYAAKALAALATRGDAPAGDAAWVDFLQRVHRGSVQPYYARHMAGGGWPEGWNYGPLATINMLWPTLGAASMGIDLAGDAQFPFAFGSQQAAHVLHFTWPDGRTMEDRGALYPDRNPSGVSGAMVTVLAGYLESTRDPLAPTFRHFAREARAFQPEGVERWQDMLFWNPSAPERDSSSLPQSYVARGMQAISMRSSWSREAVWAAFTAGTYAGNPDSGEMYFDQGALSIVRGSRPLLVNAIGALNRHRPGTQDGEKTHDLVYEDLFGNNDANPAHANRTLFNIFYASARRGGQGAYRASEATTMLGFVEDRGAFVAARGDRLEEMYRKPRGGSRPVRSWTRQLVFLRPSLFVVHDWTEASETAPDQWNAFHFGAPLYQRPSEPGTTRYDVGEGNAFAGTVTAVLPRDSRKSMLDVFGRGKVTRLELRPSAPGLAQRWVTVFDAAEASTRAAAVQVLSTEAGNVRAGKAEGVILRTSSGEHVVLAAPPSTGPGSELRYVVAARAATHVLSGLTSGASMDVQVSVEAGNHTIRVRRGEGSTVSSGGLLAFRTDETGALSFLP